MKHLTRRQFLKLMGMSSLLATLAPALHARAHYPTLRAAQQGAQDAWVLQGRAIHPLAFYAKPDTKSEKLNTCARDETFKILGETHAPFSAHNDLWYETDLGYVHSAWALPMKIYAPQPFIEEIPAWGFWGQISQVHTGGHAQPSTSAGRRYRFYGGNVFHVVETFRDDQGDGWYKVVDDYPPKTISYQWVQARDMRRIPKAEFAPIHPFVGNKRIEVSLSDQRLDCYEGDTVVYSTLVASGAGGDHATPVGEHAVLLKQASRHMSNVPYAGMSEENQPDPNDIFDLPGIPWNTFFDLSGTAIHGVYWHNDFGVRRSHGCLNVPSEAARFIYFWTHPIGGFEDEFIQSNYNVGTPIHIA